MKGMDLFCSSVASTAIASSCVVDPHGSTARRSTKRCTTLGGRNNKKSQLLRVPCSSSQMPINPNKHRKSSEDKHKSSRKGSVKLSSLYSHSSDDSSRRYLLSDMPFIDWVSDSDKITSIAPAQHAEYKTKLVNREDNNTSFSQIVVLRVSLHCKACEGKVRKHISKIEGVTSFSIDMEAKKVTIMGHVTPLGVLASVSKVKKNAQLWSSPTSSSSSLTSFTTTSQWSA